MIITNDIKHINAYNANVAQVVRELDSFLAEGLLTESDWYKNGLIDALDSVYYFSKNYVSLDGIWWAYDLIDDSPSALIISLIDCFMPQDNNINLIGDEITDSKFLAMSSAEQGDYIRKSVKDIAGIYPTLESQINLFLETLEPSDYYDEDWQNLYSW